MMRRTSFARRYRLVVGLLLLLLGFVAGWVSANAFASYGPATSSVAALLFPRSSLSISTPTDLRSRFDVFWEVWELVDDEFYTTTPLDHQRMVRGAVKGMLAELDDPYTVYQEPDLAAQSNEYMQGTFEGIGAYIRVADDKAFIDRPFEGSPARAAGVQQDDEVVKIDGDAVSTLIQDLDPNQAATKLAAKIRGPKGTSVTLTLRRGDGAPFEVTIVRDAVVVSSVTSQLLAAGVAYIQITDFKATTTADFDAALRELLPQRPRGLILDLRNNPGGYLQQAQEVLGRLYDGTALYEEDGDGQLKAFATIDGPADTRAFTLPLVVLVNGNSASASEIVAGALRDERPATYLLGEKTFGKGSVQNIHTLSDGGSARITIAHWLTPDKQEIHDLGITPQFVVPYNEDPTSAVPCVAGRTPAEGQATCADSQLAWALTLLTTGQTPPVAAQ